MAKQVLVLYSEIKEAVHQDLLQLCLPKLASLDQERLLRYRHWQDARCSLLGRLLIGEGFRVSGETVDLKALRFTGYNKPYFPGSEIQFNVSHADGLVVALFSKETGGVGIDIEKLKPIEIEDFYIQMTTCEKNRILRSGDTLNAFYRYWTQKEAVIKAHGHGLSLPLKSFEVKNDLAIIESKAFCITELFVREDYLCHLATMNTRPVPKVHRVEIEKFIEL